MGQQQMGWEPSSLLSTTSTAHENLDFCAFASEITTKFFLNRIALLVINRLQLHEIYHVKESSFGWLMMTMES